MWDPMREQPPEAGDWETCVAFVRDFDTMSRVFQWLNSGQHVFDSVILDSLTEIQKRCLDMVAGTNAPTQQDWGTLLRSMEALVRQFRDLTMHPTNPIQAVVFVTTTRVDDMHVRRPHLQGQLGITLPYFVDVVGYVYPMQNEGGELSRYMMVQPYPGYAAKDRTGKLPAIIEHPNIEQMMEVIYG